MSLNRCIDTIERCFDQQQDAEALVEELAELEGEIADEDSSEVYYQHLTSFLMRADELLSEEELNESLLVAAISNLRTDLEKIRESQVPDDPLEHLFLDMVRYQAGTVPAGTTLTTLSRYESLLLALRDRFERSTDPTDDSEVASMMRTGLDILEAAGKRLRQDLGNGLDYAFDEIKDEFSRGTDILMEFRKTATFINEDGEELD